MPLQISSAIREQMLQTLISGDAPIRPRTCLVYGYAPISVVELFGALLDALIGNPHPCPEQLLAVLTIDQDSTTIFGAEARMRFRGHPLVSGRPTKWVITDEQRRDLMYGRANDVRYRWPDVPSPTTGEVYLVDIIVSFSDC